MDCYGRHHGKRQECHSCQLSAYCKDAADIPPLDHCQLDDAITPAQEFDYPKMDTFGLLSIMDKIAENPIGWKMVREAMFNGKSLSQAAEANGLHSKQAGHYHAMRFFRRVESSFDAWEFKYRPYISKYWHETPPWLQKEKKPHEHANLF